MSDHAIVIACRDTAEGDRIREIIGQPSAPVFHKSAPLLAHLDAMPESFLIMTPLLLDETASGLLTKRAIIHPGYNILYASHGKRALNILRLYGCGCSKIIGPDETEMLKAMLNPTDDELNELVTPPFFIDDDESSLKTPSANVSYPIHVTFLGAQAMSSCANALLNIRASRSISMATLGPTSDWTREQLKLSMREYTLWNLETKPLIIGGSITFCQNFNALTALEPTAQHFIICHGWLSPEESQYIQRQNASTRVFTATGEGYLEKENDAIKTFWAPERLWDAIISALYGN